MFHNTMIDNGLNLFCLVDELGTTDTFPVEIESTKTICDLKKLIKTERLPAFTMSLPMGPPCGATPESLVDLMNHNTHPLS
ncbi:hypothetical protein BKA57DRAFT_541026 [Linnemannia elongata]|nr:hypothetical protein BKA57DRAFT_541026 [Linnemannia elongata]